MFVEMLSKFQGHSRSAEDVISVLRSLADAFARLGSGCCVHVCLFTARHCITANSTAVTEGRLNVRVMETACKSLSYTAGNGK